MKCLKETNAYFLLATPQSFLQLHQISLRPNCFGSLKVVLQTLHQVLRTLLSVNFFLKIILCVL